MSQSVGPHHRLMFACWLGNIEAMCEFVDNNFSVCKVDSC